ncbi:uncharacterized protein LOC126882239 [Diabrotica virgifera virgifera]|uniref:DUF7869 domain-containing protein n=1 Tax=Diabrotica virgifera virgifera TaxID=50390 RepID=A0ABM5JI29_DIAVI|nr:uncharacterized protein LOC126878759 [Diabrotica virgifera virgifera]XP_050503018.1 uncharacterized protein LOC126882239 [Diabrotica virgifera virgifera]
MSMSDRTKKLLDLALDNVNKPDEEITTAPFYRLRPRAESRKNTTHNLPEDNESFVFSSDDSIIDPDITMQDLVGTYSYEDYDFPESNQSQLIWRHSLEIKTNAVLTTPPEKADLEDHQPTFVSLENVPCTGVYTETPAAYHSDPDVGVITSNEAPETADLEDHQPSFASLKNVPCTGVYTETPAAYHSDPDVGVITSNETPETADLEDHQPSFASLKNVPCTGVYTETPAAYHSDPDAGVITSNESPETADLEENQPTISSLENVSKREIANRIKIGKNKRKYPIKLVPCSRKCRRSCEVITSQQRKDIWEKYWDMSYVDRKRWLCNNIQIEKPKKVSTKPTEPKKKNKPKTESRYYFFPTTDEDGNKNNVQVCKTFFLNTLGFKCDAAITSVSKCVKSDPFIGNIKEKRGGRRRKVLVKTIIETHINSFHPCVSHYRRYNAPKVKYLPRELTLKLMFDDFKSKYPNFCAIESYRKVLKSMNISFCLPKSDKCSDCQILELKLSENPEDISIQEEYNLHKLKVAQSTSAYKNDSEKYSSPNYSGSEIKIVSMDLQKVLLLPVMPQFKDAFFVSKLVVFNLTFASLGKRGESVCVVWHEGLGDRSGSSIIDAIYCFINKHRDTKKFIIWSDNCTAQNKNYILYTSLIQIVNQVNGPDEITIKYLTKGHTHMSADGVHGNIESNIRKKNIYDFDDLKIAIEQSRAGLLVIEPTLGNKWQKKKRSVRKNNETEDPLNGFYLKDLVEVKFVKTKRTLFYKKDFNEADYEIIDFLQKKFDEKKPIERDYRIRGIESHKKKEIIQKLLPLMPMNRRKFWEDLPECVNAQDLVTNGEITDIIE